MWIQTYTGRAVDLLNPQPDQICLEDIAHALSRICRYTGHTEKHYSVAQHSVLTARYMPKGFEAYGLLHDAAEAYIGDVSKPLKMAMRHLRCEAYDAIEARLTRTIADSLGLGYRLFGLAKPVDYRMLATEARDLGFLAKAPRDWGLDCEPYEDPVIPWLAEEARDSFLHAADRYLTEGAK